MADPMADAELVIDIGEIERMNDEIIELREDNQRLRNMCSIAEKMNDLLCRVIGDSLVIDSNAAEELNALRDEYNTLKECENNFTDITNIKPVVNLITDRSDIEVEDNTVVIKTRRTAKKETNEDDILKEMKNEWSEDVAINSSPVRRKAVRPKHVSCDWPGCELKFKDSYALSVHRVRHTGQRMFICQIDGCLREYATKAALECHQSRHLNSRRYKCKYADCGRSFFRNSQLSVHVSQCHTHEFLYKCDWPGCEYQGNYRNRLNSHKLSHTDIKPYRCDWDSCAATFRMMHHLKAHMLKHTGEKPIKCSIESCDKRFQSRQAMRFHVKRCHREL